MKLVSWNVNGFQRTAVQVGEQLRRLLLCAPDVVALQEITEATFDAWSTGLEASGYGVFSGRDLRRAPYPPPPYPPDARTTEQIHRHCFNLTASRLPNSKLLPGLSFEDPDEAALAFPEKHIAVEIGLGGASVSVHNTHLPPGVSRGVIKVQAFEAIRRRMDREIGTPMILCGDFNVPESEDEEGPLPSGQKIRAPYRPRRPLFKRWVAAEAGFIGNPNLRDVYRDRHQPGDPFPISYFTGSAGSGKGPRRYDYILASPELSSKFCRYHDDWLRAGISDHAGVEAELYLKDGTGV